MGWWRLALACLVVAAACAPYHASDTAAVDGGGTTPPAPPSSPDTDAGSDGAPDAARGGTFCERQAAATFCSDFDESTDPVAGWNGPHFGDGGALAIDDTIFESQPRALHATVDAGDTAYVERTFAVAKKVTVDFAFRVDAIPPSTSFDVAILGASGPRPLYFFFDTGKCYFQNGPDDFSMFLSAPSTGTWHHVQLVTDGATATGTFDGVAAWTAHTLKYPFTTPAILRLDVGVVGLGKLGNAEAWIDDVVVRAE